MQALTHERVMAGVESASGLKLQPLLVKGRVVHLSETSLSWGLDKAEEFIRNAQNGEKIFRGIG